MQAKPRSAGAPTWYRDVPRASAPRSAVSAGPHDPAASGNGEPTSVVSPTKLRREKWNAPVQLLPITPLHEIKPGALDVDKERARVVFLAPLTYTAAEKYFMRTRGKPQDATSDDGDADSDQEDEDRRLASAEGGRNQSPRPQSLAPVQPTLSELLAKYTKRTKKKAPKKKPTHSSVFDQASAIADLEAERRRLLPAVVAKARFRHEDDDEIERLKQYVHSMATTDEDKREFWETMKNYQRLQMEYRASQLHNHTSAICFNMEAAWNKKLLEDRHQLWIRGHDARAEATRVRKAQEDEKFERHIFETTTDYRAHLRVLRDVRLRLEYESATILPTVLLAAATQNWFAHLQHHWRLKQLQARLRGILRFWIKQRLSRNTHSKAANMLINWLQKSVAVKSVAFRVFRGIRNYVRKVKKIQRLWKIKQAKRLRSVLLIEKMWTEEETVMVDQAIESFEKKLAKADQKAARKKKRGNSKAVDTQLSNANWLTHVAEEVRNQVIKDFIREKEKEFTAKFRHQEDDLFPQLVQSLRGENPDRARSYIKAMANGYALLGQVYATLCQFPGAADDVSPILPFDMKTTPVRDLILEARDCSPPDTTEARFGVL